MGSTQLTDLVDSPSRCTFEEKLSVLLSKWKLHDLDDDKGPVNAFCPWFRTNKEIVIRDTMLLPVREEAGMGSPPEPFYTNSSECINNVLKVKVDYKRTELKLFVDNLRQLVEEQQREVEKAVVECGKYFLQRQYTEVGVSQSKWSSMSKDQRKLRLRVLAVSDGPSTSRSTDTQNSGADSLFAVDYPSAEITSRQSPVQPANATLLSNRLSVLTTKLGLPNAAIEGIAKKAVEIQSTDGGIVPAPGHRSEAKMVISRSGKRPHLVLPKKKSGGLSCDDDCPQYKSAKLCSHTVAAAEYNHQLDQFISSYGNIKKVPNITKLATTSMPRGRGRKGSKAPSKRRPPVLLKQELSLIHSH